MMKKLYYLSFLVLFFTNNLLYAQQLHVSQKVSVPQLTQLNSMFGNQVAQISGNQAIYGDKSSTKSYIFEKDDAGQWEMVAELTGSDVDSEDDWFGSTVSITHDRAIVGSRTGKAYIFEKTSSGWQEVATISADGAGYVVAISGDYVLIGNTGCFGPNGEEDAGCVYVYERTANGSWEKKQKLYASDAAYFNYFGSEINMDGNRALIGVSPLPFTRYSYAGYVFERDDTGSWNEVAILESYGVYEDNFSPTQAISGDYVAFGDVGYDFFSVRSPGEVYIYENTADDWELADQFNAPDKQEFDDFGNHVALDDNTLLVQTRGRGTYYYNRSADGQWEHKQILRDHYLLDISGDDAIAYGPEKNTVYFFNKKEEEQPDIAVTGFSLVDADNNRILRSIEEGDVIDLNEYNNDNFNILAHTEPEKIGSVMVELEGLGAVNDSPWGKFFIRKTESKVPYALFGDKDGDFRSWQPERGVGLMRDYTLIATPYTEKNKGGMSGKPLIVEFELIEKDYDQNKDVPVTSSELTENDQVGHIKFVLVDADNNVPLQVINEWDEINLQQYPNKNFNIHMIPRERKHIGSVVVELELENSIYTHRIENVSPYVAFGDRRGDYRNWQPELGWYTLRANIYDRDFGDGQNLSSRQVRFRIVDEPVVEQPAVAARSEGAALSVYPNPAVSQVHAKVVSAEADQPYQLSVFNAFGEKVFYKSGKGSFNEMIDLNRQQPGLYMVVIESQGQREVKRLLVKK